MNTARSRFRTRWMKRRTLQPRIRKLGYVDRCRVWRTGSSSNRSTGRFPRSICVRPMYAHLTCWHNVPEMENVWKQFCVTRGGQRSNATMRRGFLTPVRVVSFPTIPRPSARPDSTRQPWTQAEGCSSKSCDKRRCGMPWVGCTMPRR